MDFETLKKEILELKWETVIYYSKKALLPLSLVSLLWMVFVKRSGKIDKRKVVSKKAIKDEEEVVYNLQNLVSIVNVNVISFELPWDEIGPVQMEASQCMISDFWLYFTKPVYLVFVCLFVCFCLFVCLRFMKYVNLHISFAVSFSHCTFWFHFHIFEGAVVDTWDKGV